MRKVKADALVRGARADLPLPVTQLRSLATAEKLLDAAERLLAVGGAESATLRAIAEAADVSMAIVYRRFEDKDTILRAVYMRFFERGIAANAAALQGVQWSGLSTEAAARTLIGSLVRGYRANRKLLRALILYARTHDDAGFRERALAVKAAALRSIEEIFAWRLGEFEHRSPKEALRFAVSAVGAVAQDQVIFSLSEMSPGEEARLVEDLVRLFVGYLGVRQPKHDGSVDTM